MKIPILIKPPMNLQPLRKSLQPMRPKKSLLQNLKALLKAKSLHLLTRNPQRILNLPTLKKQPRILLMPLILKLKMANRAATKKLKTLLPARPAPMQMSQRLMRVRPRNKTTLMLLAPMISPSRLTRKLLSLKLLTLIRPRRINRRTQLKKALLRINLRNKMTNQLKKRVTPLTRRRAKLRANRVARRTPHQSRPLQTRPLNRMTPVRRALLSNKLKVRSPHIKKGGLINMKMNFLFCR